MLTIMVMLAAVFLLTACGFQPLHSQAYRDNLAIDVSSMIIEVSGSRMATEQSALALGRRYSELLKAEIESQSMVRGHSEKLFKLTIDFTQQEAGLFVNPDGTASRGDLTYSSSYVITRLLDGKQVASGSLTRTSSYNTSPRADADYSSYVSIEDARKRGIMELAQDYKLRLASLLPTLNNPKEKPESEPQPQEALPYQPPPRHSYETFGTRY